MQLKTLVRTALMAFGVGIAVAALVACGGAPSGDIPTTTTAPTSGDGMFTASDLGAGDPGDTTTADDGHPQGPPEELLAACAELSADAACSFTSPRDGTVVEGTCRAHRDDPSQYICFPDDWDGRGGPGHGRHGPPEESLAACADSETGVACSFETSFGTVEGVCGEGFGDSAQVACRPDWADGEGPFGPGGGHGPRGDRDHPGQAACENHQVDAACTFEGPLGTVNGTCRTGRDGSTLVCAPANWPSR